MIKGIHHIAILAGSERSVDFYKKLGLEETYRKDRNYDMVVLMAGHGIQLEIFIDPTHPERPTDKEYLGIRHFALQVDDCDEMRKHFECTPVLTDWHGIRFCFTKAPDGLTVEFHE